MNSRERNAWARAFNNSWRVLQLHSKRDRLPVVPLSTPLVVAARRFRDDGGSPESVARGLYMGTQDAMRQQGGTR